MELAAGFLTLVLTDIVGSTAAWDTDSDAADAALQHHDSVLASVIGDHRGVILKHKGEGDSSFSVFEDALDAVNAAVVFLRRLEQEDFPLPVRVALHSGDLRPRDGDYYGPIPNRAARIRALAEGQQVLVSAATADAVRDRLPDTTVLVDLGEHELRGLSRPERVHGVAHPDLPAVVPIGEPEPPVGNIPAPIDRFIGRDEERILLDKASRQHRLVTVVGPGGIGKSRLALQVAAEQAGERPSGTWVIDVADVGTPELLPAAVAGIIGVDVVPGQEIAAIAEALARPSLVVLDTCEAHIDAAAQFAEELLRLQPRAAVLATSREPLGARGEAVLRLDPMELDGGARELFLTRAAAADLTFGEAVDDALVTRICHATEGVPLAIELVAGRLAVEQLAEVASAVDDLHALLGPDAARRRTGPARQRTLSDTIRWSVDALSDTERAVLVRLTAFAGGWPASAAAVVGVDDTLSERDVNAAQNVLARRSLIVTDRVDRERQRLLDTVRETVQDLFGVPSDDVLDRHLAWATERAEAIELMPIAARRAAYVADRANIRAAFARAVAQGAAEFAHRLVYAQANYWAGTRTLEEASRSIDEALALGESPRRDAALAAAGFIAAVRGDFVAAEAHYSECRSRDVVDPEIRIDVLNGLVMLGSMQDRPADQMVVLAEEALEAARAYPVNNVLAVALNSLAVMLSANDRPVGDVLAVVQEGAEIERSLDAGTGTRLNLAVLLVEVLDLAGADRVLDEIREAAGDPRNLGLWWDTAILVAGERGRFAEVADGAAEILRLLDNDEAILPEDQLGPLARKLTEWGAPDEARRVLSHMSGDDGPARAWLALQSGDIAGARESLGPLHPSTDTSWFTALAAEIELADGHPERVEEIVAPALRHTVERGRLRGERRLLRVLRDAAAAQGVEFTQRARLDELEALADR